MINKTKPAHLFNYFIFFPNVHITNLKFVCDHRNFHRARCDPFARCCRPSRDAAFRSPRNRFVAIFALRATSSATLACWARKTMMRAVTKIVSCVAIRGPFAVTRTRRVARTANICPRASSVARHSTLRVSRKRVARADMLSVRNRHQWRMERYVRSVVSVGTENVCRTVRHRDCRVACVTSFRTRAKGKLNKYIKKNNFNLNFKIQI